MNKGEVEGIKNNKHPDPPHDPVGYDQIDKFTERTYNRLNEIDDNLDNYDYRPTLDDTEFPGDKRADKDESLDKVLYRRLDEKEKNY